jgi:hypothetical protein
MADLSIIVDSTQVKLATEELKETARQALEAHKAYKTLSTQSPLERHFQTITPQINAVNRGMREQRVAFQQSGSSMRNFGLVVQQSGYQVGDFLVQVQGGTNWMVAFGQQATQLAGLMTTFGGKLLYVGAALSILIPLSTAIGAAFMRTRQQAESAASAVLSLADAQDKLNRTSAEYGTKLEMLRFGVDTEAEAVALREILDITTRIQRLNREYAETDSLSRRQSIAEEARELKGQLSTQQEIVDTVNEKRQAYETALAINKQMQAVELAHARAMGDRERERVAAGEAYYQKMLAVQGAHAAAAKLAADLDKELGKGAASALKLAGVDISKPLSAGAAQAAQIAASLGVAYNQAVGIMNTFNSLTSLPDERGSQRTTVRGANTRMPEQPWLNTKGGGGGGGGGGGNSALESLIGQLQTEREVLEAWYEESQTLLASASEKELTIIGGRNEAKLRLEQEYQEKLKGIREIGNQTALDQAGAFFGEMAQALQGGNEKMVRIGRAFGAIEATINAWRAYSQVIADPSVPWFMKIPKAVAVLAAGMNAVRAIKGGGSGGGGTGGSPGTSTVAPAGQSASPQTVYIDSIDPEGLYSGQTLMNLFDAFYNENDRRGKVFVVGRA